MDERFDKVEKKLKEHDEKFDKILNILDAYLKKIEDILQEILCVITSKRAWKNGSSS